MAVNLVFNFFFKPQDTTNQPSTITLHLNNDFEIDSHIQAEIKNNTQITYILKNECPNEPLNVFKSENNQWVAKTKTADIKCTNTVDTVIKPGETTKVLYGSWNHSLFGELGRYKLSAYLEPAPGQTIQASTQMITQVATTASTQTSSMAASQTQQLAQTPGVDVTPTPITIESNEFEIKPKGFIGFLWTAIFYQPLYNILIFFISITPGHNLGVGIILLTIVIRTILLIPSQNALKSQRKLQEIQPKLNRIKEKYKDNQEMIAKETMAIWKENKVNPMGSCLPLLIQFPVLIALYYVVQDGLNPDNAYLLYGALQNFNFHLIQVNFLNLIDLTQVNSIVMPLIVGGFQFLQMKLAIAKTNKQRAKEAAQNGGANKEKKGKMSEMEMTNNMMLYIMPVMIALFTASVPAGVGLYWTVSTLYGIGQQLVVNSQVEKENSSVRVKVIDQE